MNSTLFAAIWPLPFVAFVAVGSLIASRHPGNRVGWLFCGVGLLMTFNAFASEYAYAALGPARLPLGGLFAWLGTWTWVPAFGGIPAILFLFPTGRPSSPAWRWPLRLLVLVEVALVATSLTMWDDRGLRLLEAGISGDPSGKWMSALSNAMFPLLLLAVASMIVRFRRARDEERAQLKWVAYATVIVFVVTIAPFFFVSSNDPIAIPAVAISTTLAVLTIPVAAAVAILRYRLYEIDLIINRTLVYGLVTGGLAATYFLSIVALQQVLPLGADSDIAVAASTLAVAALFGPLRRKVQGFVDRRFYRSRYDATRILDSFSGNLRTEVDFEALAMQLETAVETALHPSYISLWVRGGRSPE